MPINCWLPREYLKASERAGEMLGFPSGIEQEDEAP